MFLPVKLACIRYSGAMHVTFLCYITISERAGGRRGGRLPAGSLARRPRAATLGSRVLRAGATCHYNRATVATATCWPPAESALY